MLRARVQILFFKAVELERLQCAFASKTAHA